MNHGSIGFLTEDGKLSLEQEVLDGLCLGINSKLYGLFYPCRPGKLYPDYESVTLKNDFMLTPIPPRFWPISARIHLHVKHQPKSMDRICEYFAVKKISIIHGEGTRSAYRYATWSLHTAFEDLLKESQENEFEFNTEKNYYTKTFKALTALVKDLNTNPKISSKLFLFAPDYFPKASGTVNAPLAYFTDFYRNAADNKWIDEPAVIKPFELKLEKSKTHKLLTGDNQFNFVISYLKEKNSNLLPAITFSELDTRSLNIRTVLIPPEDSKRFIRMQIGYERIGGLDSCLGIIHSITSKLPDKYDVWQNFNHTKESTEEYEKGDLVFLIEDRSNVNWDFDPRTLEAYVKEATVTLDMILKNNAVKNIKFNSPIVSAMPDASTLNGFFKVSEEEREIRTSKYDLFISYSRSDEKYVLETLVPVLEDHGLKFHYDKLEIQFGDLIKTELLNNILGSREMCVIVSEKAVKSEWVTTEWGAAWILSKRITPIILNGKDIPSRLKDRNYVIGTSDENLNKFAKEVLDRKLLSNINIFRNSHGK